MDKQNIFGNKIHEGLSDANDNPLIELLNKTIKFTVWVLVVLLVVATALIAITRKV